MKIFNVDLFYKGVPRFCATNLSKFKMSHLSSYLDIGETFPAFNFPWIFLSKMGLKIGGFESLKFTYEWRQQMWRDDLTFGEIV